MRKCAACVRTRTAEITVGQHSGRGPAAWRAAAAAQRACGASLTRPCGAGADGRRCSRAASSNGPGAGGGPWCARGPAGRGSCGCGGAVRTRRRHVLRGGARGIGPSARTRRGRGPEHRGYGRRGGPGCRARRARRALSGDASPRQWQMLPLTCSGGRCVLRLFGKEQEAFVHVLDVVALCK